MARGRGSREDQDWDRWDGYGNSQSWSSGYRNQDKSGDQPYEGHGIKLSIVLKSVPVVEMSTDSIFHGNASWLLQAATGSSGKADGLYEYFQDREIASACVRELGLSKDELSIARLKTRHDILVVGTNGKRSVMIALCIALALRDAAAAQSIDKDIRDTDPTLSDPLSTVLAEAYLRCEDERIQRVAEGDWSGTGAAGKRKNQADSREPSQPSRRKPRGNDDDDGNGWRAKKNGGQDWKDWKSWGWQDWGDKGWDKYNKQPDRGYTRGVYEGHGVKLNIVCNSVPVVELAAHSVFHGNASWLLQAVTGSCAKADGLYEYYQDKNVASACVRELGISRDEMSICRLKSRPDVMAVGTNGKRAVMFALCLLVALLDPKAANALDRDIKDTDASLTDPLEEVLLEAYRRCQDDRIQAFGQLGQGGQKSGQGASWRSFKAASPLPPRRRDRGGRGRKARAGRSNSRQVVPDVDDLDQQLEAFMAPDPARGRD